jgi:hypothetical protein
VARNLKAKAISVAALELGALCLLAFGAFAAPPLGRPPPHMANQPSQFQGFAQQLDLRLPSHAAEGTAAQKLSGAFPSQAHPQSLPQQPPELPLLGSEGMHTRPTIQDLVQRVHREGLPVARLFETKSALLHLGLSPRGKPGLWLVQKTH